MNLEYSVESDVFATTRSESFDEDVLATITQSDNLSVGLPGGVSILALDALPSVPFEALKHANGCASDIPDILINLDKVKEDVSRVEESLGLLSSLLIRNGTIFNSSCYVIPFVAHIVLSCQCVGSKLEMLRFLVGIAMASSPTHFPSAKRRVCKATLPLVLSLNFSPIEPSVQNLSACFFSIVAPPDEEPARHTIAKLFAPALQTTHTRFRILARTVRSVLLRQTLEDFVDLEQLETDLFESAEEWEAQYEERERLLTMCRAMEFRRLPTDVHRTIKRFLYEPVDV